MDGKPLINNAVICSDCTNAIDRALGDLDWLLDELDTTMTRQTKTRPARGNHASDGPPMPYNVRASDTARDLRILLKDWVSLVAEGLAAEGKFVALPTPATAKTLSSWLMHHVTWLSRHAAAPDAYSEIVGAVNNIRRTIDIAPDVRYIGPCYSVINNVECPETLYGIEGQDDVKCRTCGTVWDARARTLEALAHAEKVAQDATTLSRSFALKGIALDTDRIKKWGQRGHLHRHGTSHRGYPTYIVAHVARLVTLYEAGTKLTPWPTETEVPA
ncbi:hypothetical protein [Pseudarthrobacter cellobiosi]|uniref:hypothetical protein n=1 Tax=Pseudarthrobacter cellobiosi TaxID=2953654 RepID=UPI00208DF224|nr:hypothetical protein [Pseudarthrobacter sp. HLT1-5]MCO4257388.1 hypothetical protein [Pseudarthrobacter sp. HLT1-5]